MTQLHVKQYKRRNKSRFNYDDVESVVYEGPLTVYTPRGKGPRSIAEKVTVTLTGGETLLLDAEPFDDALEKAGIL